jgi:hypothetical protein
MTEQTKEQKHREGNICCEGCYRIGKQEAISEFKEKLKGCFGSSILTGKPYSYSLEYIHKQIEKTAQEIK